MFARALRLASWGVLATMALGCEQTVYIGIPIHGDDHATGDGAPPIDAAAEADGLPPFVWYLHASGSRLLDSRENEVHPKGINWAGMESPTGVPDGLHVRTVDSLLDQIAKLGFNLIRIPFSNASVQPGVMPAMNGATDPIGGDPSLAGLSTLQILDRIVAGAAARQLRIVLDRYRFTASTDPPSSTWYSPSTSETQWIDDWRNLASRYLSSSIVVGFDLHEEPANPAVWGGGDALTDWPAAAEKAGNAILGINHDLLIIVEGVDNANGISYWPGGNLSSAQDTPVGIDRRQLAYSIHDYGRSVKDQPWFSASNYPDNLPVLWESAWGKLVSGGSYPVIVGAFGDNKDELATPPDVALSDQACAKSCSSTSPVRTSVTSSGRSTRAPKAKKGSFCSRTGGPPIPLGLSSCS